MMKINDGGPAFPRNDVNFFPVEKGMTLRDWFAGQALSVVATLDRELIRQGSQVFSTPVDAFQARLAYELADAMLAEREKGGAS